MRGTLLLLLSAVSLAGTVKAVDGRFVDAQGGTLILRGVNVAGDSKVPPFEPARPEIFQPLPKWGFNVVRLLFTWEAYEPEMGQYDDSYLNYYITAVQAAESNGLYVIVDFHQDGFSRWLPPGCGEGFPKWALPPSVTLGQPDNGAACAKWALSSNGLDQRTASWNAFYDDSNGAQTAYLSMLSRVVSALLKEPMVLGYDLLNEPDGDEVTQIGPFYEAASKVVRAADPTAILFLSPRAITGGGLQSDLPTPSFTNLAYSPHYYDPGIYLFHGYSGRPPDDAFMYMTQKAASWKAPLLVGEYGAPPDLDGLADYMDTMQAHLDAALASATQWVYTPDWTPDKKDGWNQEDFSIVDDKGALRASFEVRPFARRIAGTPTKMEFADGTFTLAWDSDPSTGDTEIFAPGLDDVSGDASCSRKGDLVSCHADAGARTVTLQKSKACGLTGAEGLLILMLLGRMNRRARRPSPARKKRER